MHRAAALALCLALAAGAAPSVACAVDPFADADYPDSLAVAGQGGGIVRAWFDGASTLYPHFVLGRQHEPTLLHLQGTPDGTTCGTVVAAGEGHVFEDVAPRIVDLDGDGAQEVIVVRSRVDAGAQLAIYGVREGRTRLIAATPVIGRPNRWLAPVGAADLDGDGRVEVAWVDRPHLARTLRIWRFEGEALHEVAVAGGLTNHRIGDPDIAGGLRDCGAGPEMILATADWSRMVAVTYDGGSVSSRDLGPWSAPAAAAALACR